MDRDYRWNRARAKGRGNSRRGMDLYSMFSSSNQSKNDNLQDIGHYAVGHYAWRLSKAPKQPVDLQLPVEQPSEVANY